MLRGFLILIPALSLLAAELPYPEQIAKIRAEDEQDIKTNWLPLVGLYWLKEGDNAIGSNPKSEVPLPASTPASVGTFNFTKGKVLFRPSNPPLLKLKKGAIAKASEVKDDEVFLYGTVEFFLIRRGDRVAVRVRDSSSTAVRNFKHLEWFMVDASWRIPAKFTPWDKPRHVSYDTVIPGLKEDYSSPGYVTFRRDNKDYTLDPVEEDGQYFYVFRDGTSGKTTYPAARYLYSDPPKNGVVVLDFNTASNPPCAVTSFATCPLPPPRNRLQLSVNAGERMHK